MAVLKYANQSGVVYAYESISEWDPVKKQSRSKRRCLGRVDPDTGEIIPTSGKRGRPSKKNDDVAPKDTGSPSSAAAMERLKADYEELKEKNRALISENKKLRTILSRIQKELSDI